MSTQTIQNETSPTEIPEVPQIPLAVPESLTDPSRTDSLADLHSSFGNSLLSAAATGGPPPNAAPRGMQLGHGNSAVARLLIQRKANAGADSTSPNASAPAPALPEASTAGTSVTPTETLIVEDNVETVGPRQLRKTEFLAQLRNAVCAATEEELAATQWSAAGCPYLDRAFAHYATLEGSSLERIIRRYVGEAAALTSAASLIPIVTDRVRRSVITWRNTGQITGVPEGAPPALTGMGMLGAVGGAISGVAGVMSGAAAAVGSAVSSAGGLLFKERAGGAKDAGDPQAIQSQLGAGHSLDAGARSRMESAFGNSFGDVRVHADAGGAALSNNLNARAFTVGRHIAFGAGEYQPGTLIGDALIAHELAHVTQQRSNGTTVGSKEEGSTGSDALETDADEAAVGAVVSAWSGAPQGFAKIPGHVLPSLKSGLRLQRCSYGASPRSEPTIVPSEEMSHRGFDLHAPPGEPSVGRTYPLSYTAPPTMPAGGFSSGSWFAQRPGEQDFGRREGYGLSNSWTLNAPGEWYFLVRIPMGTNTYGLLIKYVNVRSVNETTQERLGQVPATDLTSFLVRLELQNIQNIHTGIANQQSGANYITLTSGDNPARIPEDWLGQAPYRYAVHTAPGITPTRYEWSAIPENLEHYPHQSRQGQVRRTVAGRDGFFLSRGTSASWPLMTDTGTVMIYCTMYDAQDRMIAEANYRQVVLSTAEGRQVSAFQDYMREAREQVRLINPETAVYVPGVHLATATGTVNELSLFLGTPVTGSGLKMIDVTPGVNVREFDGADFPAVLRDFNQDNSYPDGQIRFRVPNNRLGVPVQEWLVTTSGASLSQRLSSGWGWASLGFAALGVVAAATGLEPLVPVFFTASAALGAASAGAGLYQLSQEAHPSGISIAINIAALAGSLLGLGSAARALRYGPRIAAATQAEGLGLFVLYGGFTTDLVGGVLIFAQGADQIAEILDGRGAPDEKAAAVTRILAGLALNGLLLGWGARNLGATRRQVSGLLDEATMAGLSNSDLHALSLLEGPALARIAGAGLEEVQTITALIRENPNRALALINQFGERFVVGARSRPANLDALTQALYAGAPELAGTRGSFGPAPASGPRPVYIEGIGQSNPSGLSSRIRGTFANPRSPYANQLSNRATLRAHPDGQPTHFELVIPSSGTHAEMVIPVRIESSNVPLTSVHGEETGPARMRISETVNANGTTRYEASIEVHRDLASSDVPLAVGHELDELIGISLSGIRTSDINAQMRASLLRPQSAAAGAAAPPPTAHDLAAAREFELATRRRPIPPGVDVPEDLLSRALSLGFGGPDFLAERLALLRNAGVSEDMLQRLRVMALRSQVVAAIGDTSPFATASVIDHLITRGSDVSTRSPVNGLHLESALQAEQARLVAANEGIHLVRTADSPRTVGGVTYNAYEQWRWTGGGSPPLGSRPTAPAGSAGARHGDWQLAPEPKTTFDNLTAFLQYADSQWSARSVTQPPVTGSNQEWTHAASGGIAVGGYFSVDAAGRVVHTTVFPRRTGGLSSW